MKGDRMPGAMRGPGDTRRLAAASSVTVIAAVVLLIAITYLYRQHSEAKMRSVRVEPCAEADCGPVVDAYLEAHPGLGLRRVGGTAGIVIDRECRERFPHRKRLVLPGLSLRAGSRSVVLEPEREYWLLASGKGAEADELAAYINSYRSRQGTTGLTAAGDIIAGRTVAKMMALKGVAYPFEAIAPTVSNTDVTFAVLECPLSDRVKPPYQGLSFIAPSSTVEGLKMLGLDVVSLANNHSTDFGAGAFTDTLELLEAHGIGYTGGGRDVAGAWAPAFVDAGGTRLAFLAFNSIRGSTNATASGPGAAWIDMPPSSKEDREDQRKGAGGHTLRRGTG